MVKIKNFYRLNEEKYPNHKNLIGYVGERFEKYGTVMFYNVKGKNPYRICVGKEDLIPVKYKTKGEVIK